MSLTKADSRRRWGVPIAAQFVPGGEGNTALHHIRSVTKSQLRQTNLKTFNDKNVDNEMKLSSRKPAKSGMKRRKSSKRQPAWTGLSTNENG
jgi:hypothetical protein